jgi:hypothetical protein
MKKTIVILLFTLSSNSQAGVGCKDWLPQLPDIVKSEIEKVEGLKVKSIEQLSDVKKMKFWDDRWAARAHSAKVNKFDRARKGDRACGSELHLDVVRGQESMAAICMGNALIFNSGEVYFTLDNCEEFTRDKSLAATLNNVGKLPSK